MALSVTDLTVRFDSDQGSLIAVENVSFQLRHGEILGVVGESGCGKTVTSKAILRLLPEHFSKITNGKIQFGNDDLVRVTEQRMRQIRGAEIAMIFQDPMSALNPVFTIGYQITEAIAQHRSISRKAQQSMAIDMLKQVGIPSPERRFFDYPHQLSGGMRQRVMIAMALVLNPKVLLADEPTTALDVTLQAQILDLMDTIREKHKTSIILVTHDLGVVAEVCDRVVVMYAGRVVEQGSAVDIFKNPRHPYTARLMESLPQSDRHSRHHRLPTISGLVPDLRQRPAGCRFADRCLITQQRCVQEEPELVSEVNAAHETHSWRCHYPLGGMST
ncbi:MAG: ABC transporter ATP-binding protein [Myxococcales bacterium]|nr:ABC transporter ATP-binding protein [Myxococcales bacterium]